GARGISDARVGLVCAPRSAGGAGGLRRGGRAVRDGRDAPLHPRRDDERAGGADGVPRRARGADRRVPHRALCAGLVADLRGGGRGDGGDAARRPSAPAPARGSAQALPHLIPTERGFLVREALYQLSQAAPMLAWLVIPCAAATLVAAWSYQLEMHRARLLAQQRDFERAQAEQYLETDAALRVLRHDLRNHLSTVRLLVQDDPARAMAYLDELEVRLRAAQTQPEPDLFSVFLD